MGVVLLPLGATVPRERGRAAAAGSGHEGWTLRQAGPHPAFLASVPGLSVHRPRQFPGRAAPVGLCRRCWLRPALCRGRARDGGVSVAAGRDPDRHALRLCRPRTLRYRDLWDLDSGGGVRADDPIARPASTTVAARVFLRPDLGCEGTRDHGEDGRSVPGPEFGDDPGRDHDRHWPRRRWRLLAGRVRIRRDRQLSGRVHPVHPVLCRRSVAFWALRRPPAIRA